MIGPRLSKAMIAVLVSIWFVSSAYGAGKPEDELAGDVKLVLGKSFDTDWRGLEKLTNVKWAPLPPTMLQNCLPDGGCFTRQGVATIGGRSLGVLASGARTMVFNIYLRNTGAAFGEPSVVAALKAAGFSAELARCPVPGGAGSTNWYRLKSATTNPGYFSIQSSCNGKPCEGFVITASADLPALQPNQLKMYSEQCSGSAVTRKPVATAMPHEQLAAIFESLIPAASGPALYDWKTLLTVMPNGWLAAAPKSFAAKDDPNPWTISGNLNLAGRQFSLQALGLQTQVRVLTFDENGLHPRGEDLLGVLRGHGYDVRLARCGPVYTESTNNWYSVTSAKTRPVMLLQSVRMDGKQLQDAYVLRLDNTLPKRDLRDRDPGVGGCR